MQVSCTECQRDINIPDEKVPKGQVFNLTCPGCKSKFRVDQHLKGAAKPAVAPAPAKAEEPAPAFEDSLAPPSKIDVSKIDTSGLLVSDGVQVDDDELEIYEEDDKVALILDDKNRKVWVEDLESRGYKFQFAHSPEHAIYKMKYYKFDLLILHETFGGVTLGSSPIYKHIIEMSMVDRRKIFVILSGEKFRSTNNMEAFTYSVNLVINEKDFSKLGVIVKKAVIEHDIFYKVFNDAAVALGKV